VIGLYDGVTENIHNSKAYLSNPPKNNYGPKIKLKSSESPIKMMGS